MESFVIIATERWGAKGYPVAEYRGCLETIIEEAVRIFRTGTMQKVIVVDSKLKIVFRDTRRCKCTNVQEELSPSCDMILQRCMDCGLVMDHKGFWRVQGGRGKNRVKESGEGEAGRNGQGLGMGEGSCEVWREEPVVETTRGAALDIVLKNREIQPNILKEQPESQGEARELV